MTNKEKYTKEILDIFCETITHPALTKEGLRECDKTECSDCLFSQMKECEYCFQQWLKSEYKEPEIDWTKVPENTRILVRDRDDNPWINAHFAYYRNGHVFAFPYGRTSWTIAPDMTICPWNCAEIADPNEQGKYLKYE